MEIIIALLVIAVGIYVLIWPVLIHSNLKEQTKLLKKLLEK